MFSFGGDCEGEEECDPYGDLGDIDLLDFEDLDFEDLDFEDFELEDFDMEDFGDLYGDLCGEEDMDCEALLDELEDYEDDEYYEDEEDRCLDPRDCA